MTYFIAKAIHLAGMSIWMGTLVLSAWSLTDSPFTKSQLIRGRRIMTLGLIATWTAGLWLAVRGDWFSSSWLAYKLSLVLLITVLHSIVLGKLYLAKVEKRLFFTAIPSLVTCLVFVIAFLAGSKLG